MAVVGSGIYGQCIADYLSSEDLKVELIDDGLAATRQNGSSGETRLHRLTTLEDITYAPLAKESLEYYETLQCESSKTILTRTGFALVTEPGARRQRHHGTTNIVDRAASLARTLKIQYYEELGSDLVSSYPALQVDPDSKVFREPGAHTLYTENIYEALQLRLLRKNVKIVSPIEVTQAEPRADGRTWLHFSHGPSRPYDHVVLATGPGPLGLRPKAAVVQQPVQWFETAETTDFPPIVLTRANKPLLFGFPGLPGGRGAKFVHENESPMSLLRITGEGTSPQVDPWAMHLAESLPIEAQSIIPSLGRPLTFQWQPYVIMPGSRITVTTNNGITVVTGCSGHGFKLAPAVARRIARAIGNGRPIEAAMR